MGLGLHKSAVKNPILNWVDQRLPIFTFLEKEYAGYPAPRNFNYLWNFGAIAMVMLFTMIISGIILAMHYTSDVNSSFSAVERIMRDVNNGWLIRYIHMNGASMFFIAVYIHIFRGMYYGSYKHPRELLWILGVTILLLMMATAFMGYVLPWGQMSFWGAKVITNLFSAIPLVGEDVVVWLWGGFSVDNPTLTRFFALHFVLPFVIVAVVFLHVAALHITGSNNPLGIEPKSAADTLPFHPYYTVKDMFGLAVFLIFFAFMVFFFPNYMGHPDNYIPANPLVTPAHIVPEWYFLPFYAILRAVTFDIGIPFTHIVIIDSKLGGVLAMFGAVALLFVLPWLDKHKVRSARFRPWYRVAFWLFVFNAILLGFAGAKPAEGTWLYIGQFATFWYYFHFLGIIPFLNKKEPVLTLPISIADAALAGAKKMASVAVLALCGIMLLASPALAAGDAKEPREIDWPHSGLFGTYDRAALQRGFQVYKEVCSACHGMRHLSYRHLTGIGLTPEQVKAIAAEYTVMDGPNDEGEMFERPALPSDTFKKPFANEQQARAANNGAYPVDMSLIVKARHGGENYIYSLLTGYGEPPADMKMGQGMNYNPYFSGGQIAMAAPIVADGQVTYADGTNATVDQMARDVSQFLTWASEPHMEARKQTGVKVILFLFVFAGIMYAAKRRLWRDVH